MHPKITLRCELDNSGGLFKRGVLFKRTLQLKAVYSCFEICPKLVLNTFWLDLSRNVDPKLRHPFLIIFCISTTVFCFFSTCQARDHRKQAKINVVSHFSPSLGLNKPQWFRIFQIRLFLPMKQLTSS